MSTKLLSQLKSIGFTDLEATLYISLLESDTELTGYAIAKLIDKPAANVYLALTSLSTKGAILCSESSNTKHYMAVPINEYIALIESSYRRKHKEIIKTITDSYERSKSTSFYNIESIDQALSLSTKIIVEAKKVLLIDISYEMLNNINASVTVAINDGVDVYIKTTKKGDIPRCKYIIPRMASSRLTDTPFRWIEVSADSNHYITANLSKDLKHISSGLYCKGEQLGYKFHSGLAHEIIVTQLSDIIESSGDEKLKNRFISLTHNLLWKAGTIDAFESTFEEKH